MERTCIGCRRPDDPARLVRLVWAGEGVVVDARRVRPGRGAWLHDDPGCRAAALKKRALPRALRRAVPVAQVEPLLAGRLV